MEGIRPCPYCGSEVEVVRVKDKPVKYFVEQKDPKTGKKKKVEKTRYEKIYRIYCMHCKQTVARGLKFEKETDEEGAERIAQYEAYIAEKMKPMGSNVWRQTKEAKIRDYEASMASRIDKDDEVIDLYEM